MPEFNTTLSSPLIHLRKLWLQTCGWLYFQYIMNQWPSLFQCTILRDRMPIQQGEYAKLLLLRRWVQFPLSPVSWETRTWEVSHNSLLSTLSVTFISSALMAQNDICLPKILKLYFQPQLFLKFQTNISNYLFNSCQIEFLNSSYQKLNSMSLLPSKYLQGRGTSCLEITWSNPKNRIW